MRYDAVRVLTEHTHSVITHCALMVGERGKD